MVRYSIYGERLGATYSRCRSVLGSGIDVNGREVYSLKRIDRFASIYLPIYDILLGDFVVMRLYISMLELCWQVCIIGSFTGNSLTLILVITLICVRRRLE